MQPNPQPDDQLAPELLRVRRLGRLRIAAVWAAALVLVLAIALLTGPERRLTWVSIAMMMLVLLTGLLQLNDGRSAGFIHRFALSLTGAAVILIIATVVFMLTGAKSWVLV